ncbi:hypothetical protein HG531_001234 [Fusarium graminearum]|nr:hypothetical protein HG531_001234 [Fusarium graminearum]
MIVDFSFLVRLVISKLLLGIIDQIQALDSGIYPSVLLECLRLGCVCALDIGKIELSCLGEDPLSSKFSHTLIKFLDTEGMVLPVLLEVTELLKPLVHGSIILVGLVDGTPLGVKNNDCRKATVKQVEHLLAEGVLDLVLNLLPDSVILHRREQHSDGELCAENTAA